jgi:hypothetical protein
MPWRGAMRNRQIGRQKRADSQLHAVNGFVVRKQFCDFCGLCCALRVFRYTQMSVQRPAQRAKLQLIAIIEITTVRIL